MLKYIIHFTFISLAITFSTALGILFYITQKPWLDFSALEHYNPGKPSIVLDDEGKEWTRFQLDRREVIHIKDIPDHVINAFLAAEDWDFFKHSGLSFRGIIRSILINIYTGKKAQGASTITQQLVRLLYFDAEKSFKRKIKEQMLSIIVERQFTKEQILETYLNHTYFGAGIYGIEAASQRFWNKKIKDVSIAEAAVLASIVQLPQRYCPLYHPESTLKRRNSILAKMLKLHFISQKDYDSELQKPITVIKDDIYTKAPHLKETIRIFLEDLVGKQKLYSGGLKIQTTINVKMQETAEAVFHKYVQEFKKNINQEIDGALLTIEGKTGAIKTLIGGFSYQQSQFNRALKAHRQMGSTFKPLIYANALESGKKFTDIELDEPMTIIDNNREWSPSNSTNRFDGPMTLAKALMISNNIITIKTFINTNPHRIIDLAKKCGLKDISYPYPSLALGCTDATLQEVTCLINIFAQQGNLIEPYFIEWVKDEWGKKLWRNEIKKEQVLSSIISDQVGKVLTLSLEKSAQYNPQLWPHVQMLGKTGTTNDSRTCWFIGATPEYTTGIYIGCDNNKALGKNILASKTARVIWRDFNKEIKHKIRTFENKNALQEVFIDGLTGQLTDKDNPNALSIYYS